MKDWFAPVVRHVIAPAWAIEEKTAYLRHLRVLERTQFLSEEALRARQWVRLKRLLNYAYQNCPFYHRVFDAAGVVPSKMRSWTDFQKLPLLNKKDIRAHGKEMIAEDTCRERLIPVETSGSTGTSLFFYMDEFCRQWRRACTIRHDRWAGWDIGERIGLLWTPTDSKKRFRGKLRNLLLERGRYLAPVHMTEEAMESFARSLIKKPASVLCGIAHALYLFALFVRDRRLNGVRLRGVITAAMVLLEKERQTIKNVFSTRVFNRYGCEEVSLIASECEAHSGLHINMDTLIVEVLKNGRPAESGEAGQVVVTDLMNYAMPFIRYKIGDIAVLSKEKCPCGRGMPLLEGIEGRTADYVVTPAGGIVSGISLTDHFALLVPGLEQIQIIQERTDLLRLRIVKGTDFDGASTRRIGDLVRERFGSGMSYECEFVSHIPQDASGKYRFVISKVPLPVGDAGGHEV